jgi:glycosyltransferase involved in cell wall biosynthesis
MRSARIDVAVGTFVAPPPDIDRLVFDVFDDNVGYSRINRTTTIADEIQAVEQDYLRRADAVVAASSVLRDRVRSDGYVGPLTLIPNGVHLDAFSAAAGRRTRDALGLTSPVVGLVGNHDKWIELEKVLEVARLLSDTPATFLIVGRGSALKRAAQAAHAARRDNVRFVGFVPPTRVSDYFSAIDVGLCPYSKNTAADAASPLRLLSHSAAGSAVVCTDLEEVRRMGFPNVILVGDSAADIARGIREALGRTHQQPPQIVDYDIRALARRYERVLLGDIPKAEAAVPDSDGAKRPATA